MPRPSDGVRGHRKRAARRSRASTGRAPGIYLIAEMNFSIGIAASVVILMLPRADSSAETRAIVSLSGASTTLRKSYGPSNAYWLVTRTPSFSTSLLTSRLRAGCILILLDASLVRILRLHSDADLVLLSG